MYYWKYFRYLSYVWRWNDDDFFQMNLDEPKKEAGTTSIPR